MTPEPGLKLVDGLVAELLAGGEALPRRHFTMSREEAARKVETHLLADRHAYVLLLVQAARLQGATWVRFDIDSDDVRVRFDGAPLALGDLDDLYDAVLGAAEARPDRARRELGIALASALQLGPAFVRVLSGDGEKATLLSLSPGVPEQVKVVASPLRGTTVHVRDAASLRRVADAWRVAMGTDPHEVLLRDRCRLAPFPIHLAGVNLADAHRLSGVDASSRVDAAEATGLVGFRRGSTDPPRVTFTVGGVSMATHAPDLGGTGPGLVALVDGPMLRKDLSQADVIQDDAYHRVCAALVAASDAALQPLAEAARATGPDPWLVDHLRAATARLPSLGPRRGEPGLHEHLRAVPVWPTVDGRLESLDRLAFQAKIRGHLLVAPADAPVVPRGDRRPTDPTVLRLTAAEVATLRRLVGEVRRVSAP